MSGPQANCTCTGCPPKRFRILFHYWQETLWQERGIFESCDAPEDAEQCQCPLGVTAEDLLCDECREQGGISGKDERRIREFLDAHPDRYATAQP